MTLAALLLVVVGLAHSVLGERYTRIISVTFLISGLMALVGSRGRHLSWILFLAVAALVWWAN